jgi:hypothetical protein
MRIFVRKMSQGGLNYFVFDGYAPQTSVAATKSGAVSVLTGPAATNTATFGSGSVANGSPLITLPSHSPFPLGWYFAFFFYLSALPSPSAPCVLLDLPLVNGSWSITGGFRITYNYTGNLGAYFYGNSWSGATVGPSTTQVFAPHRIWWAVFQLGMGLTVNAGTLDTTITNLNGGTNLQAGNYGMFLMSDSNGANTPPAGSWISKVSFGCDYNGSVMAPYASIPTNDSGILNGNAALGSGLTTYGRWMINDLSSGQFPDTGAAHSTPTPLYADGTVLTFGPY